MSELSWDREVLDCCVEGTLQAAVALPAAAAAAAAGTEGSEGVELEQTLIATASCGSSSSAAAAEALPGVRKRAAGCCHMFSCCSMMAEGIELDAAGAVCAFEWDAALNPAESGFSSKTPFLRL